MAEQIALVTKVVSGTGDVDFTDPSITESFTAAILVFSAVPSGSDGTDDPGAILGYGFLSSERNAGVTGDVSMCWFAQNGQNTSPNAGYRNSTNRCVSVVDTGGTGTLTVGAVYVSDQPGGFRVNFSTFTLASVKVTAVIIAGAQRGSADTCGVPTTSSSEPVGGTTTYEPDVLILAGTDQAVGVDASSNLVGAAPTLGFAVNDGSDTQVCAIISCDDGTEPSDADGAIRSNRGCAEISTSRVFSGGIFTFTSSGFDRITDNGPLNARYLALQFTPNRVRQACANLAVSASTGVQSWSNFGFVPDLVFGCGTLLSAVDAALEDGAKAGAFGIFISGRFGSRAWTWHTEEGLTLAGAVVANSHTRQEDVGLLMYDHQGNVVWRATWAGSTGGGSWGLDFSTASQAGFLTVWGLQLIPAPHLPVRRTRRQRRTRARIQRRPVLVGGRPVGSPPLTRGFWKAVQRIRRALRARLRRQLAPFYGVRTTGETTDEGSKGRTFTPGMRRGNIVGPGVSPSDPDQ